MPLYRQETAPECLEEYGASFCDDPNYPDEIGKNYGEEPDCVRWSGGAMIIMPLEVIVTQNKINIPGRNVPQTEVRVSCKNTGCKYYNTNFSA